MKAEKLKRDKWGWQVSFKYRKTSPDDFVVERKSVEHPEHNAYLWLSKEEALLFVEFVKKSLKESEKG